MWKTFKKIKQETLSRKTSIKIYEFSKEMHALSFIVWLRLRPLVNVILVFNSMLYIMLLSVKF